MCGSICLGLSGVGLLRSFEVGVRKVGGASFVVFGIRTDRTNRSDRTNLTGLLIGFWPGPLEISVRLAFGTP